MKKTMNQCMAKVAFRYTKKVIVALFVMLVVVVSMVSTAKTAHASPILGLLFNEVSEVHVFKRPDGKSVVVVKGRAWGWHHQVTFPAADSTGRQCLTKFVDLINRMDNKQLQFGGYSNGQVVDTPNQTTRTEFSIITECYFR